ncbi:hypothetical protein MACH17_18470 [Phaeobacter inhibens]|uniref:hypothetical protein n=1 Tax=Phaeobacter inhibens TaxID=221822 RepID=UPI00277696F8|nr:hypothetical protein [Phaeobacter inhibens]GLO70330.1 hypothetical protein MACH17_18470 [Phaeobacter inhibens]
MPSPHNTAAAFAVHIEEQGQSFRVYLQRNTICGVSFALHKSRRICCPAVAAAYADELAETHGGLAVVHH